MLLCSSSVRLRLVTASVKQCSCVRNYGRYMNNAEHNKHRRITLANFSLYRFELCVRACPYWYDWFSRWNHRRVCVFVRSHTRDQWCNIHSHDGCNVRARSNDRKSTRARAIFTQYQCSVAGAVRTLWNSHTVECVMKWLKTGHVCSNIPSSSDARGSLVCGMSELNNVRPESGHVPTKNFTAVVVAFSGPASHSVDIFQNRFPISCTVRASHVDKRKVCYVFFLVAVVGINLAFGHIRMRRTLD